MGGEEVGDEEDFGGCFDEAVASNTEAMVSPFTKPEDVGGMDPKDCTTSAPYGGSGGDEDDGAEPSIYWSNNDGSWLYY